MMAAMGRENAFTVVLAVAAAALAGILFWEWDRGLALQRELQKMRSIPVTAVPPQRIFPEFDLPNAESGFPELLSRSLFAVSRRGSASAGKGGGAMKKGQFVLVGVMITPQQRSALLRDVQTNKTEAVTLIGVVRGITLGEVEPTRVVLRQGAESEELILNVQSGPKHPINAATPATTAAIPPSASRPAPVGGTSVPPTAFSSGSPAGQPPGPPTVAPMGVPPGPPTVGPVGAGAGTLLGPPIATPPKSQSGTPSG